MIPLYKKFRQNSKHKKGIADLAIPFLCKTRDYELETRQYTNNKTSPKPSTNAIIFSKINNVIKKSITNIIIFAIKSFFIPFM